MEEKKHENKVILKPSSRALLTAGKREVVLAPAAPFPTPAGAVRRVLPPALLQEEPFKASSFTTWAGRDPLPTLPLFARHSGRLLVISLFGGVESLLVCLLAMGISFIAVSVELDPQCSSGVSRSFSNLVFHNDATTVTAEFLNSKVPLRDFDTILVAGGSPCQGESKLNQKRKGLQDPRSQLYKEVIRVHDEINRFVWRRECPPQVWKMLENVASCTEGFHKEVSAAFGGSPFITQSLDWGWQQRSRKWWLAGPGGMPDPRKLSLGSCQEEIEVLEEGVFDATGRQLRWCGKPCPRKVHFDDNFKPAFKAPVDHTDYYIDRRAFGGPRPQQEMRPGGAASRNNGFFTFTRCFEHPTDSLHRATDEARRNFARAGKLFPPAAYEPNRLLCRDVNGRSEYRVPNAREKAAMHLIPECLLSGFPSEAGKASAVGNSFHIPSLALILLIFFQSMHPVVAIDPRLAYGPEEAYLRRAAAGTVWEPGVVQSFPGVLGPSEVADRIMKIFLDNGLTLVDRAGLIAALAVPSLRTVQCYWIDVQLRNLKKEYFGPDWALQSDPGGTAAALGSQRAGPMASFALPALLERGLTKEQHMEKSALLTFPFGKPVRLDDDLDFAARATAVLGPFAKFWRRRQVRALQSLANRLYPWELQARALMEPEVAQVAGEKSPVFMTLEVVVLRWPDLTNGVRYVTGQGIVGAIERTNIFRELPPERVREPGENYLLETAKENYASMLHRVRPGKFDKELLQHTLEEVAMGFCSGPFSKEEIDERFGVDNWRPMERFMHQQGCGKLRPIDSGKKSLHNFCSSEEETIVTSTVDVIPSTINAVLWYVLAHVWQEQGKDEISLYQLDLQQLLKLVPPWLQFVIGTDDMKHAYRQVPVRPSHHRFSVTAFWHEQVQDIRYVILFGCPFGLSSVVICFCRTPVLQCAVSRRCCGVACDSFFDDIENLDTRAAEGSGQRAVNKVFGLCGLGLDPVKKQPVGDQRIYLGQAVEVARATVTGFVQFSLKPGFREDMYDFIDDVLDAGVCTSGTAAKLRGKAGWAACAVHGKCGRGAQAALLRRQYFDVEETISEDLERELVALKLLHQFVGPRQIPAVLPSKCFSRLYSDASFEPEAERPAVAGFVLFTRRSPVPIAMTCEISAEILNSFCPRKQQITPCEALLGIIAPVNLAAFLKGEDLIWFIDNTPTCSCFIKGSSSHKDLAKIATITSLLLAYLQCRTYFEYVESAANVADGLSRDGLKDLWTLRQGWQLQEAVLPNFVHLAKLPFASLCQTLADMIL